MEVAEQGALEQMHRLWQQCVSLDTLTAFLKVHQRGVTYLQCDVTPCPLKTGFFSKAGYVVLAPFSDT